MRWLVVVAALAACNEGNPQPKTDLSMVSDLAVAPDLAPAGPSCGEIAGCVIGCGQDLTCYQKCTTGASTQTLTQLGSLLLCAGTSCLGDGGVGGLTTGGGGGNMLQLFQCLTQHCGMQLQMCPGLLSGLGGGA